MPGIVRFDRFFHQSSLSRRSFMAATVGLSGAAALGVLSASAQGTATPAGGATPAGEAPDGAARDRLEALLSIVPSDLSGGENPSALLFSWTDLQTHFAALGGIDTMDLLNETVPAGPIIRALALLDPLSAFALEPDVIETFGFSPLQVHQTLVVGNPPNQVTIYAGGVPVDDLPEIWEAAGYERKSGSNGDYWTVGEDGEQDLTNPVGAFGLGQLNNVAIVNDDVLVFAPRIELLEAVQNEAKNGDASVANGAGMPDLLAAMPQDAVSLVALPSAALDGATTVPANPDVEAKSTLMDIVAESDDAVGPMPISEAAIFGITAGAVINDPDAGTPVVQGNADSRVFADLLMSSADDAAQAVNVVDWRLQNMASPITGVEYSRMLSLDSAAQESSSGPVAAMTFTSERPDVWVHMLNVRDIWPFAYVTGD